MKASLAFLFGLKTTDSYEFCVSLKKGDRASIVGTIMESLGLIKQHRISGTNIVIFENIILEGVESHKNSISSFIDAIMNVKKLNRKKDG